MSYSSRNYTKLQHKNKCAPANSTSSIIHTICFDICRSSTGVTSTKNGVPVAGKSASRSPIF